MLHNFLVIFLPPVDAQLKCIATWNEAFLKIKPGYLLTTTLAWHNLENIK